MQWNISYAYGNGGREYYNEKNYTGVNKNGRIMTGGHWISKKIGPATLEEMILATISTMTSSIARRMTTTTCPKPTAMTSKNMMRPWTT